MSKLFLDDIRKPTDVTHAWHKGEWQEFPSLFSWEIVRSYAEFVSFIEKNGLPSVISFDHDLAWEHYPQDDFGMEIKYHLFKEKTGYECAKWLVDYCWKNELEIPDYYVHSFNPVGRTNIINWIERFRQIREAFKNLPDSNLIPPDYSP